MKPIKELIDRLEQEFREAQDELDTRSDTYSINMRFSNLSVLTLALQKDYLFSLLGNVEDNEEHLGGLINMIDVIQDTLSDRHHFPSEITFPFSNGYESEEAAPVSYKRAFAALISSLPLEALPKCLNKDPDLDTLLKRFFDKGVCYE